MRTLALAAVLAASFAPAAAQFRLPGGMGGGLSSIGTAGVGNVAGLLGYCVRNRLTGGAGAQGLLTRLTDRPGVTQQPGYQQGLLGRVLGGASGTANPFVAPTPTPTATTAAPAGLSLDGLPSGLKTQACNLVLQRAGGFLR